MGIAWLVFRTPPAAVQVTAWHSFLALLEIMGLIVAIIVTPVVLALYRRQCQNSRIERPADYFAEFAPLRQRWWSVATFGVVLILGTIAFWTRAPGAGLTGIIAIALVAAVDTGLTVALVHVGLPRLTPPKYRYRVRRPNSNLPRGVM